MYKLKTSIVLFLTISAQLSFADVSLPYMFSSNMVLQRDMDIPVWGWASPGERITVRLGDQDVRVRAEDNGTWLAKLPPMKAGGPYDMIIDGKNTIQFTNIMIGDVWICSGQSNMEWSVSLSNNAEEEISNANHTNIRLFTVPNKIDMQPQNNTELSRWMICSPETIGSFSAVGYFFGRDLNKELNVPIGLINTTWGGTDVKSWTSAESARNDPDLSLELAELYELNVEEEKEKREEELNKWYDDLAKMDEGFEDGVYLWASSSYDYSEWEEMELPTLWEDQGLEAVDGVVWFVKEIELPEEMIINGFDLNLGPIDDSDIVWINGSKIGETFDKYNIDRNYHVNPSVLVPGKNVVLVRVEDYRGGGGIYGDKSQLYIEHEFNRISIAGPWKYKVGTAKLPSNPPTSDFGPNSYPTLLFNAMINPLIPYGIKGAIWYQGENNANRAYQYRRIFQLLIKDWRNHWGQGDFPFLFVQLANFMQPQDPPRESAWAELREAQTMALELPNTGMATIIDLGEANDIHPRNKQDVGKRLAVSAYKIAYGKDIVHTGPTYEFMGIEENKIHIRFSNIGSGLVVKDPYGYIKGFTIAGKDKKFHWAKAVKTDDNTIVVYSDDVPNPVAVRYGWADNPNDLNLYNKEGLPANPFRTDDWEGITYGKK